MAGTSMRSDSMEEFKGLRITSLDDEDEEEEEEEEEDDDDDDDDEANEDVVLGFVKKPKNPRSLFRHFFPSKAGGVPAWLDPVNLPSGRSFLCDICGEPLHFMLQVYAPEDVEYAFHRTLFVFICTSMACLRQDQHEQWKRHPNKPSRSVKVFRCQLPRDNPFYSSEPPKKDDKPSGAGVPLCTWCGTWKGIKACSSCQKALYCSEKHRVKHSQLGHDYDCQRVRIASDSLDSGLSNSGTISVELQKVACTSLWPELKIIQEDESAFETRMSEENGCSNSLVSRNRTDDTIMSLMKEFEGDDERKSWASFEERISLAPEQVLRYCRTPGAKPLWPLSSGRPSKADIPKCNYCSGPLRFEFQILPQLLYYFRVRNDVDSLDWATIAVYACEASCDSNVAYKEEYAWVQLS
ncbi:Programmed cell death protein [Parasponia andersonii]|uniref:Programmed cell death protein n=1 Tax=Parasponia andersonii TaxID=3476 RepID=A0A2P5AVF4_PARAD|nr:Programmed cell death protein [Parasponia andersonii]